VSSDEYCKTLIEIILGDCGKIENEGIYNKVELTQEKFMTLPTENLQMSHRNQISLEKNERKVENYDAK
jgi:hypothetical protein